MIFSLENYDFWIRICLKLSLKNCSVGSVCNAFYKSIFSLQNRGVYMFRIDEQTVIDATMSGGPARYINHCCQPNCVAEVVPFERESKIIIIAKRRIARGEEVNAKLFLPLSCPACEMVIITSVLIPY